MDINTLRIAVTLISFAAFAVIIAWIMSPGSRAGFEQAARLPFEEPESDPAARGD